LDPEGGSQNATVVVLVVVVLVFGISSLNIPKAFLICSAAQQNFAHTFVLIFPTDLPSQILKLIPNNYQSLFHVIDLKLDNEPSLLAQCA